MPHPAQQSLCPHRSDQHRIIPLDTGHKCPPGLRTCHCPLEGPPSPQVRRPWPGPRPILLGAGGCQRPQPCGLSLGLWLLGQPPMPRANNHNGCKKAPTSVTWRVCVCVCVNGQVCICVCEKWAGVCVVKWAGVCAMSRCVCV